jgi:hypothetical protein
MEDRSITVSSFYSQMNRGYERKTWKCRSRVYVVITSDHPEQLKARTFCHCLSTRFAQQPLEATHNKVHESFAESIGYSERPASTFILFAGSSLWHWDALLGGNLITLRIEYSAACAPPWIWFRRSTTGF